MNMVEAMGRAAQAWCEPETSKTVMDTELAAAFAAILVAEIEPLEKALRSIAANTCCGGCQEAALVVRAALRVKPCMNGPPKGGPLTLEQCKALQARVASLEAALREIVDEGDGDPTAEWFVEVARSALSGAAQPRGEP